MFAYHLSHEDLKSDFTSTLLTKVWRLLQVLMLSCLFFPRQGNLYAMEGHVQQRKQCFDLQVDPLAFVVYGRAYLSPATPTNVFESFGAVYDLPQDTLQASTLMLYKILSCEKLVERAPCEVS